MIRDEPALLNLYSKESVADFEWLIHGRRVRRYVRSLFEGISLQGLYEDQFASSDIEMIADAAQFHDIGKINVLPHILNHKGALPTDYLDAIKQHSADGETILSGITQDAPHLEAYIDMAIKIASTHHERWDGLGYPKGLSGAQIPLVGRVVAIADIYDALVSSRSYKEGWSHLDACKEIIGQAGTRYDPKLIEIFKQRTDHFLELSRI